MPTEPRLHRLGFALGLGFRLWVFDSRFGCATLFRGIGCMPNETRLHRQGYCSNPHAHVNRGSVPCLGQKLRPHRAELRLSQRIQDRLAWRLGSAIPDLLWRCVGIYWKRRRSQEQAATLPRRLRRRLGLRSRPQMLPPRRQGKGARMLGRHW